MNNEIWPNFFIVGTGRGGTSSLYHYLSQHPDIFMSPIKEPYFFCQELISDITTGNFVLDKDKYLELFNDISGRRVVGEASAAYLDFPPTAGRIKTSVPDAKIIIMLRNPSERAFSEYLANVTLGYEKRTFNQTVTDEIKEIRNEPTNAYNSVSRGLYYNHVKRYQDLFGNKNVKVIIFEDFIKNTQLILEEVLEFLGINKKIEFELEPKNQYRIPKGGIAELLFADSKIRKIIKKSIPVNMRIRFGEKYLLKKEIRPTIDLETKKILDDIYSEDINKLSNLLNRELKWKPFQKD